MKKVFKIFNILLILVIGLFFSGCDNSSNKDNVYNPPYEEKLKAYFINVGQGDCQLCMLPNGMNVLIDAGLDHDTCFDNADFPSWDNIMTVFNRENIKTIDYFIITHNHMDHYKYAEKIINNYDVKNMVLSGSTSPNYSYKTLMETILRKNINTIEAKVGMMLIDEEFLKLQVVSTQKIDNPKDCNICSVCTKLTYNERSILSMGDAGYSDRYGYKNGETIAMESGINLKSDVLKVGHHGSRYSSSREFLSKVKPEYAIMTTSNITDTGHPHRQAIDRIKEYTLNILESRIDGTILVETNGRKLEVITHIGE